MDDAAYMEQALALAREAAQEGEVPVGCIITLGDQVVGRGRNRQERSRNALSHGELEAIDQACKTPGRLASVAVYPVCHPGALPHVCRSHCQRPDSPGGLRRPGSQGRGLRLCVRFVCGAFQSSPGCDRRGVGGALRPSAPGFFRALRAEAAKPKKVEKPE